MKTKVTLDDLKNGSWIMSIDEVEKWLTDLEKDYTNLAVGFCSLKRWLTEHIEEKQTLERSLRQMDLFLDKADAILQKQALKPEELTVLFGILMTIIGEVGPYRYETKKDPDGTIQKNILGPMEQIRIRAVEVSKHFFSRKEFAPIKESIEKEIFPLLDVAIEVHGSEHDQFMGFRIIQIGKVAEQLLVLSNWLNYDGGNEALVNLLRDFYNIKYPRFGTSGLRGKWDIDFTEIKARRTAQAIAQYLKDIDIPDFVVPVAKDMSGKWIVIGYDGRRNSQTVANWLAEVVLASGFPVYMCSRPTPTPVIAFLGTEHIGKENIAGIINCTASHNPSDWQGIKFNPNEGFPAPTHLTDIIANRINEFQLMDISPAKESIDAAEEKKMYKYIDPFVKYWDWIKQNGQGNNRIPLDFKRIREYFKDRLVLVDEMHGAGRGYMSAIFGEFGIPHRVLHAERDMDLGVLDYANPELPFIQPLIDDVIAKNADLGIGLDTDADRFGIVDKGGVYFRPNQILMMLSYYLGNEKKLNGRIVITQTGLPVIDAIAGHFPNIERPDNNVIPSYVDTVFYKRRVGERSDMEFKNAFVVPVGIKYIVEVPRMFTNYKLLPDDQLGRNWMDRLLLGGEESSGLTTRGHVPDKDGLWADLLVMDMIAYYQKPLSEIWKMVTSSKDAWVSYGGRVDVDATDHAKEKLINYYLDKYKNVKPGAESMAGYPILYVGGIRYDMVEIFIGDHQNQKRNFLRIRASGTEPINRVYTETSDPDLYSKLQDIVLNDLDDFTIEEIMKAYRLQNLADIIMTTKPHDWDKVKGKIVKKVSDEGWKLSDLTALLEKKLKGKKYDHVENRNRGIVVDWLKLLK